MAYLEELLKDAKSNYSPKIFEIIESMLNENIKVVTFDIFDTLLLRPVSHPLDVSEIVGEICKIENFRQKRTFAESHARKYKSSYIEDISIEEIYDSFRTLYNISDSEVKKIMQCEIDVETDLLYPRKTVKLLFDIALASGKKIYILSDMYLSSEVLGKILKKNGIEGFSDLFVSCEKGVAKFTGNLYSNFLNVMRSMDIMPNQIMHFGDNNESDIKQASRFGISAVWMPKPMFRLEQRQHLKVYKDYSYGISNGAVHDKFLYGIMANMMFDDPFVEFPRDTYFAANASFLGYFISPILINFVKWLIDECVDDKIEKMIFIMRDGYLPQKMFKIVQKGLSGNRYSYAKSIETTDMYCGRKLRLPFFSEIPNGLTEMFLTYPPSPQLTISTIIKDYVYATDEKDYREALNIFNVNGYPNEEMHIGKYSEYAHIIPSLEHIFKRCTKNKLDIYREYIHNNLNSDKKTAVFDRSPRAESLKFFETRLGFPVNGYTFDIYNLKNAQLKNYKGFISYSNKFKSRMSIFHFFIEKIISMQSNALVSIEKTENDFKLELCDDGLSSDVIDEVQNAVVAATEVFSSTLGKYMEYLFFDQFSIFEYTFRILTTPTKKDAQLFQHMNFDSGIGSKTSNVVFNKWYSSILQKGNNKSTLSVKEKSDSQSAKDKIRVWGYNTATKFGVLKPARAVYRFLAHKPQIPVLPYSTLSSETETYLEDLRHFCAASNEIDKRKFVLFTGFPLPYVSDYLHKLSEAMPEYKFVYLAQNREFNRVHVKCLTAKHPPKLSLIDTSVDYEVTDEMCSFVESAKSLSNTAKRITKLYKNKNVGVAITYERSKYFTEALKIIDPALVMVWSPYASVTSMSSVASYTATELGIPVVNIESGFLPDTLIISPKWFGESCITCNPQSLLSRDVSSEEISLAEKNIDMLKITGANRYVQLQSPELDAVKLKFSNGKPTILVAGMYDIESQMFPYGEEAKEYASPVFASSHDSMLYISKLAKKNDWNVIYKPHPIMIRQMLTSGLGIKTPSNVMCITTPECDINKLIDLSDVVVTIISGVSYQTLIRGKALLMTGYTPLNGKGCNYEAYTLEDVEPMLKKAICDGYTSEQRDAFIKHVAQMNKYYLFDTLKKREMNFGQSVEQAAEMLNQVINGTKKDDN